jgi:hypothetical protein
MIPPRHAMSLPRTALPARRPVRLGLLAALLALGACANGGGGLGFGSRSAAPAATSTAAPAAITDPVAAFAAQSRPGAQGTVTLAGGQSASVRLVRAYQAASGRECREVLVGSGMAERAQLVCATEGGGWAPSRPLLRGGAAGQP